MTNAATISDAGQRPMAPPTPRGPAGAAVLDALLGRGETAAVLPAALDAIARSSDVARDADIQLALFCLYELHYGGIEGVEDRLEWDAGLLAGRAAIEAAFEAELRKAVETPTMPAPTADAVAALLFGLAAPETGPSSATFIAREATREQIEEMLIERSVYTLKEADPHSWAIPRLSGRAKAALVEVQSDEYGGGRPRRMHSVLFADALAAAGLDDANGGYVDVVPATTLAAVNAMSMFGLNRRLRGAIVGHLAAYEMTSSVPCAFIARGIRRVGLPEAVARYYDEHVEADSVHEQIAARDLAGGLAEAQPELLGDIVFGAAACLMLEGAAGRALLDGWQAGESALLGGRR